MTSLPTDHLGMKQVPLRLFWDEESGSFLLYDSKGPVLTCIMEANLYHMLKFAALNEEGALRKVRAAQPKLTGAGKPREGINLECAIAQGIRIRTLPEDPALARARGKRKKQATGLSIDELDLTGLEDMLTEPEPEAAP